MTLIGGTNEAIPEVGQKIQEDERKGGEEEEDQIKGEERR